MATPVWKRILKWLAWLVGGVLALVVLAYLVVLAINWRDEPPSAAALKLTAIHRDRPAVADADNGFVYVMGFTAGADEDYKSARSPAAQKIADSCKFDSLECAVALEGSDDVLREWIRSEQWLLDRYRELQQRTGWRETIPTDISTPLPSYGMVVDGQRLLLAKAYLLAGEKDIAGVRELLSEDVRFWRHVLESSDILISKMIAVATLNRTFEVGNLILRRLPPDRALEAMPKEWTTPLSDSERSLSRTLAGEWLYGENVLKQSLADGSWSTGDESAPRWLVRLSELAMIPLYQPQSTSNDRADMFVRGVEAMNVPFEEFPKGLERAHAVFDDPNAERSAFAWLYNPMGDILLIIGSSAFTPYGARVVDVEGVRRAVVLAVELRGRKVAPDQVSVELGSNETPTSYLGEPFEWDTKTQSIVFVGQERRERGRHAIKY